jgi:hypothetical protein
MTCRVEAEPWVTYRTPVLVGESILHPHVEKPNVEKPSLGRDDAPCELAVVLSVPSAAYAARSFMPETPDCLAQWAQQKVWVPASIP